MILLSPFFRIDPLSLFIGAFVLFFFLLTLLYSSGSMRGREGLGRYYSYLALTFLAAWGAVFSSHLVVFLMFWGFLALLLYLLIGFGEKADTPAAAKKTMVIVGGSDALMVLGLALIWRLTGSLRMDQRPLELSSASAILAYLCLSAGAFAKAGAMPFHSWVPDVAEDSPSAVTAFLPASLDKLLGIYFLVRLSLGLFRMTPAMNAYLMVVGSFTIVAAVMMALVQHDLKRLLGYHAVSQVGYMVLGIGTGTPVGIAGGLFHMLNHAVYKSCLFLGAGAVEKSAGTTDLGRLGGLSRAMPVTFGTFLVAALAISGVPPLNGFFSKWMIYQGIIETARGGGHAWVLWLVAAMFGSALTLASFMKVVHAVFLGQPSRERSGAQRETGRAMWVPTVVLAILCVAFGLFAYRGPLRLFILPSLNFPVDFAGTWRPGVASGMVVLAIALGFLLYWLGTISRTRETEIFVGGETVQDNPDMRVSGVDFYRTIQEFTGLSSLYALAQNRRLDPYELGKRIVSAVTAPLRQLHNGVLPTYLSWCLLGACALFYVLLR